MIDVAVRNVCHLQFIDWPSEECVKTEQHLTEESVYLKRAGSLI